MPEAASVSQPITDDGSTGMTSDALTNGRPAPHPELRLRLKPSAPVTGHVDGAWWPRSHDLAAELPALAEVLAVRLGRVERVSYPLSMWDTAPRRTDLGGHSARLEGFSSQDRNTVHVTGANRDRVSLLVVPPEMAAAAGQEAMTKAARGGNTDRPEEILAAATLPAPRDATEQGGDTR